MLKREKEKESDFIPLNKEDVKHALEIPVKNIDEKDLIKIEKKGTKKRKSTSKKRKSVKKKAKEKNFNPVELKEKPLKKQGYVLVITEKPQAAEKISAALSEGKDKKINMPGGVSYYEFKRNNKPVVVACAVGHLFSVSQTKKGTDYPIFDIGWFPNYEVRKKDFTKKYYDTINKLAKNASEIVVATDFDVEGEVIGYNIVRFITHQKDAKRMKFSVLTAPEIQKAYDNVLPTIEWGQAIAGETRHFLDWLYGINLSRALMNAIKTTGKFRVMSIGRVQGPTLHMIVDKEKQINAFESKPYWQIFITIKDKKNKLELKHNKDITNKKDQNKFKKLKGKEAEATTTKRKQTITPPAPFDLTTLQTEAYKFHGITPSNTLRSAQSLYLKGLISYPRTSSQKIPDSIHPEKILEKLSKKFAKLTKHATRKKPIEGKKSDPAHPAIIPTGTHGEIEEYDKRIYHLIVKRFISCYCSDAELESKRIEVIIDKLKFAARGIEILNAGWMEVYPTKIEEKEIQDFNGKVKIDKVRIEEKETKPPQRYSPASILRELEKRNLGTKCLTGDTKIIFNDNEEKIENIFKEGKTHSKKGGVEIRKINGIAISLDKDAPLPTNPKFISKRIIEENEKIIQIDTDSSSIKLTENHLIYISKNKKIIQVKAQNLKLKDKLVALLKKNSEGKTIIKKNAFNEKYKIMGDEIKHKFASKNSKGISISKLPLKWSTSLAWTLGYYYGDGSYDGPEYNGSHSISFCTTETKALNLLRKNIKNIFGYPPYAYNLGTKYKINCNSVMAYALIKAFPELNGKKPIDIPKNFIGDFLRGFFDADGNVHLRPLGKTKIKGIECKSFNTPRVKFTLGNEKLILWVQKLLQELEIETKINKGIAKCNGKKFDCWTILISGKDKIEKFAYKIGFDSYKEDILYRGLKCKSNHYKILQNSSKIALSLIKKPKDKIQITKDVNLKEYSVSYALKRLQKLKIITKKKIGKYNWHYSIKDNSKEYISHCIKIICNKIKKEVYEIPIKKLSKITNYQGYVYDLSVEKESPNFITAGNILVHNSTRANILETLYDRNYVKDKQIKATELGMRLIASLKKHSPIIIDEKLTREIEKDMDNIKSSKKDLNKKQKVIIEKAEKALTDISKDFKKKEKPIGKELVAANEALWAQQKEENKLGVKCPGCKKGELTLKYTPRFRSYFVACTEYPECKQTFSLPSQSLIKKADKACEECGWPKLMRFKAGKRPWVFCFNPNCVVNKEWREKKKQYAALTSVPSNTKEGKEHKKED